MYRILRVLSGTMPAPLPPAVARVVGVRGTCARVRGGVPGQGKRHRGRRGGGAARAM